MREAILRAAAGLFATSGPEVSLDEVAATAGSSTRQLQEYFTSLAGIHCAMSDGPLDGVRRQFIAWTERPRRAGTS